MPFWKWASALLCFRYVNKKKVLSWINFCRSINLSWSHKRSHVCSKIMCSWWWRQQQAGGCRKWKPCCVRVGRLSVSVMLPGHSVLISQRCVCVTDVGNVDKWCSRSCRRPCTSLSINHRRRLCSGSSDSFFLSRRLTRRRTLRGRLMEAYV